jgi:hypothetical protein
LMDSILALPAKTSAGEWNRTIPTRPASTEAPNDLLSLFDFIKVCPFSCLYRNHSNPLNNNEL